MSENTEVGDDSSMKKSTRSLRTATAAQLLGIPFGVSFEEEQIITKSGKIVPPPEERGDIPLTEEEIQAVEETARKKSNLRAEAIRAAQRGNSYINHGRQRLGC